MFTGFFGKVICLFLHFSVIPSHPEIVANELSVLLERFNIRDFGSPNG